MHERPISKLLVVYVPKKEKLKRYLGTQAPVTTIVESRHGV